MAMRTRFYPCWLYSAIPVALIFLILAAPAFGCSWLPLSPEVKLERSDLVLTGRALEVKTGKPVGIFGWHWRVATLEVYAVWKGDPAADDQIASIDVWTTDDTCEFPFFVGEEYLIYARYDAKVNAFTTSGPDGTHSASLRRAVPGDDYEILGEPVHSFLRSEQPMTLQGIPLTPRLRWVAGLGVLRIDEYPWVYLERYGWFYIADTENDLWAWRAGIDWTYTSLELFPYAYSVEAGWIFWSWGRYYSFDSGTWVRFDD